MVRTLFLSRRMNLLGCLEGAWSECESEAAGWAVDCLRVGAGGGGGRAGGERAVLLRQLVQARLQALDAPVELRHAPLRQLPHPGHLRACWR